MKKKIKQAIPNGFNANKQVPSPKTKERQPFRWSFSILDFDGPFGWNNCESKEKFLYILKKKGEIEDFNFQQLIAQGSHPIAIDKIIPEARKRLKKIKQDDVAGLFSLHFAGKHRVWCILVENVFKVLWWDPDHKICPCTKKHT